MHSQEPPWLPYQGWPNSPTWDCWTVLTSDEETRQQLDSIADAAAAAQCLQRWVKSQLQRFLGAEPVAHGVVLLAAHWATDPARRIDWSRVAAALQGEGADCSLTPLEATAVEALRSARQELPSDPSLSLSFWWDSLARRWAEQPELRLQTSPLGTLARSIIESYAHAVDWSRLVQALREE
ncbi:hypothetical protein [Thermogemmatispora carboxidivorans]|uniref:hypothetical protein n=1 Tax=Thermogemmatispora carboxidivorans TaxID=1382306 RepID=UPI00069B3237|nr:hypothetical protein [Thermogemmatispora carboxidivorans]